MNNKQSTNDYNINVLLFEDNKGDSLLLKEMLSESGRFNFSVVRSETLGEGLRLGKEHKPDIILADLGLPDSNGLETFSGISREFPEVPIILMTGLNDEELATEAMRKGAQDYIVKGQIDSPLLVRAIRYAIERKRLEADREELIQQLKEALAKIKTLRGLLPICSFCKKIRDDQGYWQQIEEYVREHADVNFSHSICPTCAQKHYPELYKERNRKQKEKEKSVDP